MAGLGAISLTRLRAVAEANMPGTLTIHRRTLTSDGAGGQGGTVAPVGTVTCRAVPQHSRAQSEQVVAGRVEDRLHWFIYVPVGTDVNANSDYVTVSGGGTFEVLGVHGGRAYEPSRRLVCVER